MTRILNRYIFSCIALLLLVTQSFSAQAAGLPWWDTNYNLRQEITITTGANTPANGYSGYTVRDTNLNTAALITANNLQADCDDLRVARWDGSTWTEVDRHLLNCNTATTDIRFKLLVDIPASSSDVSYYFYYDNSSANAPNALDTTNVYVWYDDASTDRSGSYTFGRGDNWHGTGGTNSFTYNGTSYRYNTGDNFTNSMRRAVNERDVYIEAEFFHTNAFPNDMTSGLVTRYQSSGGSGSSESANHYYASNRADSPFLGDAGYTHDVSIMKGNRGTIAIGPADGVGAPAIAGNQWRRQALATWNVNNTNGKFWDNNDTTALGPSGWPSVAATKSGADTGTDYEGSGDAGLMVAQDQALVRNILIRRYIEAEPTLSLSTVDSQLIAYYANDETNWIGAGGEVIDQSINAYHGQAVNGAVTANVDPALTGDPGTCGYGNFDGNNDYVALPNSFPNIQDSFTITAWIQPDSGDRTRRIFADDENNTGGYGLSLGDDGPGTIRFYSRNLTNPNLDTGNVINPNRWYFVSAVHNATTKTREIYVNGALVANDAYTGTWGTDAGITSIGGETNGAGVEANNNFRFDGDIDEVRVYSQPLTAADITTVMNLRHPCSVGPAATCGPIPSTYPIYSAGNDLEIDDDVTINGSIAVEEGDNNGNAIDTTLPANNNVITTTQTLPTIDPDTFPATGTQDINIANGTSLTIDTSGTPPGIPPGNPNALYDEIRVRNNATVTFTGGGPFYIDRLRADNNATINFNAGTYYIDQLDVTNDDVDINVTGEVRIYIGDRFTTGNNDDNLSVNAGGNVSDLVVFLYPNAEFDMEGEDLSFTGVIYGPNSGDIKINDNSTIKGAIIGGDEIELDEDVNIIYDATVAAAVASITTCSSATISNFTVTHNQFGLNCATESITINAIDTDGMPYDAGGVVMTINTTTGSGNWSVITGTAANLNNGTNNNGIATYTFAPGETGVVLGLDYLQGTNTFTITATATVNGNPISAFGVLPITFTPSSFIISDTAPPDPLGATPPSFPSQIAGTNVTTHITAYGTLPNVTGCGVISGYTGNKNLAMWTDYLNPLAPTATTAMTITVVNNTVPIADTNAMPTTRVVNFVAGRATVIAKYKDVGLIRLSARDTNTDLGILPDGITGSADIIFRPADILIDAVTLADGSENFLNVAGDITAPKFIGAGNPFGIRVRAVDADGDVTPNFGRENSPLGPEGVSISSSTLVAPSPMGTPAGVNGTIGNSTSFSATTDIDGTPLAGGYLAGSNFTFSEVGIIKLTAVVADGDYLGTGLEAASSTESTNVGRFVPDRFKVTVNPLTLADSCDAFSYMDQNIDFSASPTITLEAVQENGATTKNYDIDMFWRYSVDLANRTYTNNSATPATLDSNPLPANISVSGDNDANGIGLLTITNESILYQRPADPRDTASMPPDPAIPFSADINLDFTIADLTDADGVCYDENNDGMCKPYSIANITGTQVRFGRLKIDSAFGSELVNLELPVTVEYYDSLTNDFVTATDDGCTALTIAPAGPPTWGHINLDNYTGNLSGNTTPALAPLMLNSGQATITLSAPGVGNDGSVIVTPLLNSAISLVQPWLQFDWDGDGNHDNDPTATATFGIYRGNDSTIYLRELY